ncbi:glutamine amidotransferase [Chitinivorax tropicus]|uniref:Imidazole glycerol phosphate synthase subunit HisH n=1 Tax=Chitinivorax tropicus TaxID=714531 RepID=A0A840MJK7_9PROT|nr:imidazole glycerol phosphate synthase subunit HisH [Chitinivorax tropicus]MBB5016872.1 glutamine amidotransferase [Chitinivorax tropicus]
MSVRVGIADYGVGNMASVSNAVMVAGGLADIVTDPTRLLDYDRLILPGVGAFADAVKRLRSSGMATALDAYRRTGRPILGICLGMQLMCKDSTEDGLHTGLGWFDAHVRRFPAIPDQKVPHIGWNDLAFSREHPVLSQVPAQADAYFVHSYRVEPISQHDVLAWCDYGGPFAAMIARDNLVGIQFHPEKSQRIGLTILKNFIAWNAALMATTELEMATC